ncbi:MAG: hypothetical protein AABW46_03695 [Nanoarchaeota archaeon]
MVYTLIIANLVVILLFVIGAVIHRYFLGSVNKKVLDMKKQGKGLQEILNIAQKKKWNEREVKLYYLLYFFQDFQKRGSDLLSIKDSAINAGWPSDLVNIVYRKLIDAGR